MNEDFDLSEDDASKGEPSTSQQSTQPSNSTSAGVSSKTLEKFLHLRKRREEQSRRSTSLRVERIKTELAGKIKQQFSNDDEIAALRMHNVDVAELDSKSVKRKCKQPTDSKPCKSSDIPNDSSVDCSLTGQEHPCNWLVIKQHLNVNSHLNDETGGSDAPKSHLEKTINLAIASNEFELAEELSDRLANRDFGTKIATAFDARRFIEKRKIEEEARKAAKKKKLPWGFEHKRRWETKGNM